MNNIMRAIIGVFALSVLVPALASAATASIINLSNATPQAKTSVTFAVSVSGISSPIYHISDSFPNTTITSANMNFGGNFQWVPIVSDVGTHTITVQVSDYDGNTATATQVITVLPPPSVSIQSVSPGNTVMAGTRLSFVASAPGFSNPRFLLSDSFSGSTVNSTSIDSAGNFSWTPDVSQNGDHVITVYGTDDQGHNAQASLAVRVGSGPTLTVPTNVSLTISQGQALNFALIPTGYSPTGFMVKDAFPKSTLSSQNVNTSGLVYWQPTLADAGSHSVTFIGQVGFYGETASTTVTINVLGPGGILPPPPASSAGTTASSSASSGVSDLQKQLAALQSKLAGSSSASAASGASGYIFTTYLSLGSENDEVMELQKLLKKLGFLKVAPNGYFGPSTKAAVIAFQKAHGLDALGAVGPATRVELNTASGGSASTQQQSVATSVSSSYVFEHFMGVGDDDAPDVLELQKKLKSLGFLSAEPNGYFGSATEAAVKKFQAKHGLPQTGFVAKNTRAVLNAQ